MGCGFGARSTTKTFPTEFNQTNFKSIRSLKLTYIHQPTQKRPGNNHDRNTPFLSLFVQRIYIYNYMDVICNYITCVLGCQVCNQNCEIQVTQVYAIWIIPQVSYGGNCWQTHRTATFFGSLLGCPWYLVNGSQPVYKQVVSPVNRL